jgi:hypothetical protein
MKIYKLTQDVNSGYDTYDGMIVIAKDENQAILMYPSYENIMSEEYDFSDNEWPGHSYSWANKHSDVKIELLGNAGKNSKCRIVLASFNAG